MKITSLAVPVSTEAGWAWAAGFYEGEGSIALAGTEKSRSLSLRIGQKDREPLELWLSIVQCGKIYGPYKNNKCIEFFYWQANKRADVTRVVIGMRPWLSRRRLDQIDSVYHRFEMYQMGLKKNQNKSIMEITNE